ncbi:MAG: NEW3 domain-containing protein [Xanthobacteraceae bacterium]|jgi:uncharacterized membrane protein
MRVRFLATVPAFLCLASTAFAADRPDVKGLYLLADYPAVSVQPGTTANIPIKLQNYGVPPERFQLSVSGVPAGWTATLLGGGQPIAAAMPATDAGVSLELRLDVPANAGAGTQTLTINAEGQGNTVTLPIAVTLAQKLPAKLKVDTALPALRGTSKSSFEYQLTIKNDSGRNLTVSFTAQAPKNFETSFTEAYGSQELSSVAIEAGKSKDIKLKVRPPSTADAGTYPVSVTVSAEGATAKTDVSLEIIGQPRLSISGRDGLLSMRAEAGQQSTFPIIVSNTGSAPADEIELSGSAPSGWKLEFNPKTLAKIEPGKDAEAQALVTPTEKSLAGDYQTTLRAASRGETASSQVRVTVVTSTVWGIAGVGIIAAALLIMVGAVVRFGRR